jgi:hypothetical protein
MGDRSSARRWAILHEQSDERPDAAGANTEVPEGPDAAGADGDYLRLSHGRLGRGRAAAPPEVFPEK